MHPLDEFDDAGSEFGFNHKQHHGALRRGGADFAFMYDKLSERIGVRIAHQRQEALALQRAEQLSRRRNGD